MTTPRWQPASLFAGAAVLLLPGAAAGHTGPPVRPEDVWSGWSFEPVVLFSIGAAAWLYARGVGRLWRSAGVGRGIARWRLHCFAGGLAALLLALVSPLDAMGGALFSAHMVQHEVLMLVAGPLLVLGSPLVALAWALPDGSRRTASRLAHAAPVRAARSLGHPFAAWTLYAVALWGWHHPTLYQATLTSDLAHAAQHGSFMAASLLFWSLLLRPGSERRSGYGWGVPYLFTTAVHGSVLAALLTFSGEAWYPAYAVSTAAWGLTPLEDQQLAGVIMWVPPGFVYLAAILLVMGVWLRGTGRKPARALGPALPLLLLIAAAGCDAPRDPGPRPPIVYGGDPGAGRSLIRDFGCGSCHTVPGVRGAKGLVGPPLTSFAHRTYIAGHLPNRPENLVAWIVNPRAIHPGTAMPITGVTVQQARDIAAYLYTLE